MLPNNSIVPIISNAGKKTGVVKTYTPPLVAATKEQMPDVTMRAKGNGMPPTTVPKSSTKPKKY